MEALTHLSCFSICTPHLPTTTTTKKPPRLNAVTGGASTNFSASKWADRLLSDFNFTSDSQTTTSLTTLPPPPLSPPPIDRNISIPLHFYKLLNAEPHFLSDGIKRAYDSRITKPPQYGYSQEALISRRQILQAACETLADSSSRRDYNSGLANHEFDTVLTPVPWDKV